MTSIGNSPAIRALLKPGRISVAAMAALSFLSLGASQLAIAPWLLIIIVATAATVLAGIWPKVTGAPMSILGQFGMVAVAVLTSLSVAFTGDAYWSTVVTALLVTLMIAVEVLAAPTPINHSPISQEASTSPTRTPVSGTWETRSTSSAIAASVLGLLIASAASAWVNLMVNPRWAFAVPLIAVVVLCAQASLSLERLFLGRGLSGLCAFVGGMGAGVAGAWAVSRLITGYGSSPIFLPFLGSEPGTVVAVILPGVIVGMAMAAVVVAMDALFVRSKNQSVMLEAAGAVVAFMVAAFPIYTLIRLG